MNKIEAFMMGVASFIVCIILSLLVLSIYNTGYNEGRKTFSPQHSIRCFYE